MFSGTLVDSSPPWDFCSSTNSSTDDWLAGIDLSDLPPMSNTDPDLADLLDLHSGAAGGGSSSSFDFSDLFLFDESACGYVSDATFKPLLLNNGHSAASLSSESSGAIAEGVPQSRKRHTSHPSGNSSTLENLALAWTNHEVSGPGNLRAVSSCIRQEEALCSDLDGNGLGDSDGKSEKLDPSSKRQQRLLRNRELAFESRQRKKCYIKDLEAKCKTLEQERDQLQQQVCFSVAENAVLKEELTRLKKVKGKGGVAEPAVLVKDSRQLEFLSLLFCLVLLLAQCSLFDNPSHALEPRTGPHMARSKAKGVVLSKEQDLKRKCFFSKFKVQRQLWFHPPFRACQLMIAWQEPLKQTFCK